MKNIDFKEGRTKLQTNRQRQRQKTATLFQKMHFQTSPRSWTETPSQMDWIGLENSTGTFPENSNTLKKIFCYMQDIELFFWHDFAIEKYQMISLFFSMFLYFGNQSFKEINYSNHGILILDGNSKQVAHAWRRNVFSMKKIPICACSRTIQMPWRYQMTKIASYVRNYIWVTI